MVLLNITDDRPDGAIQQILDATIRAASEEFSPLKYEGEYPDSGFGIAELRPRAVIAADSWQFTVTTSFANWINKTLGTNVYLVPIGVFSMSLDPSTSEIFPTANGKDLPYLNIEQMYSFKDSRAFFTKGYAVSPNNNLTIQAIGRFAATERFGLVGYQVAKRSYLITASP